MMFLSVLSLRESVAKKRETLSALADGSASQADLARPFNVSQAVLAVSLLKCETEPGPSFGDSVESLPHLRPAFVCMCVCALSAILYIRSRLILAL